MGQAEQAVRLQVGPTAQSYEHTIKGHISPALGHIPLARLSAPTIQRYLGEILKTGLSSTTVRYQAAILNEALHHAVRWGQLARNPMEFVDLPRRSRVEMKVWDEEQVGLFIGEARKSSRYYPLYLTAILTGARQGELLGLRWDDLNFLLGSATIQRTFYRLGKQQLVREPKTRHSRRTIPLPPVLLEELRRLREAQEKAKTRLGGKYQGQGLVFSQPNGKPLHSRNITQRDFRKVIERAKVPHIRFHDLRHCHATHLLQAGVNAKVVQERLGHHAASFTLSTYGHALPGMQEEATRLVAERLLGNSDRKD
jgi:integrase